MSSSDLVAAYRVYFSEAFAAISAEVDAVDATLMALVNGGLETILARNASDLAFWNSVADLPPLPSLEGEARREVAIALGHGTLLKDVTPSSLLQSIRPFLEDYLRARFPGRFAEGEMLAGMVKAIEAAGSADPLAGSIADLYSLNEYTRPNMHGGGEAPEPAALRAQCRKVVRIVGAY